MPAPIDGVYSTIVNFSDCEVVLWCASLVAVIVSA